MTVLYNKHITQHYIQYIHTAQLYTHYTQIHYIHATNHYTTLYCTILYYSVLYYNYTIIYFSTLHYVLDYARLHFTEGQTEYTIPYTRSYKNTAQSHNSLLCRIILLH